MKDKKPHYEIDIYKINPPIGNKFKYGAKAKIYLSKGNGKEVVEVTGEVWGKTKEEAQKKARKSTEQWIKTSSRPF